MPAAQDLFNALRRNPTVKGLPDVNTFEKALQNPEKAGQIYDMLSKNPTIKGLPSKDIFINKFSPKQPQAPPARQEIPASIAKPVPSTVAKPVPTQAQPQQQPNVGERIVQAEVGKAQLEQPQAVPQPKQPTVMQGFRDITKPVQADRIETVPQPKATPQQAPATWQQATDIAVTETNPDITFEQFQQKRQAQQPFSLGGMLKSDKQKAFEQESEMLKRYADVYDFNAQQAATNFQSKFGLSIDNAQTLETELQPFFTKQNQIDAELKGYEAQWQQASAIPDEAARSAAQDRIKAEFNVKVGELNTLEAQYKDKLDAYRFYADSPEYSIYKDLKGKSTEAKNRRAQLPLDERYKDVTQDIGELEGLANAYTRGMQNAEIADILAAGRQPTTEELRRIAQLKREQEGYKVSDAVERFNNASGFKESAKAFLSNPFEITSQWVTESLVAQMSHGITRAGVGAGMGAAIGTVVPVIGTAAGAGTGFIAGMGMAGFNLEYSSSILESLQEAGIDITNEDSLINGFSDANKMKQAKEFALKRGVPISVFDMVTGGIGGKIAKAPIKSAFKKGLAEFGTEMVGAGGGEVAAQLISKGEISGKEVFAEMMGEIGAGAPTVAVNNLVALKQKASGLKGKEKTDVEAQIVEQAVQTDVPVETFNEVVNLHEGAGLIEPQAADELKSQYEQAQANKPVKTMQDELQVGDTVEMSPEVTTAQSDTERRSRESNKNQLNEIGSNKFVKLNKEGENTELSDVELKLINSLIDKMISQGKSAKEINTELNRRGFIQSQATTPAQIERYLQSRIDGKINAKVGESISQEINAKYDAEVTAPTEVVAEDIKPLIDVVKDESISGGGGDDDATVSINNRQQEIERQKAYIERRRQKELDTNTSAGYGIIASDYLFTGGIGAMLSTDYLLQALTASFPFAGKQIDDIRKKYASKLGNILDDINSKSYNEAIQEIRSAINSTYQNSEIESLFNEILNNSTGFIPREGNRVSARLEALNDEHENKINAKYDAELAALEQEQPISEPINTEQDAEKQQGGQMRVQGEQRQAEGASDSDMPSVNEAGLPIGQAIEEEIKPVTEQDFEKEITITKADGGNNIVAGNRNQGISDVRLAVAQGVKDKANKQAEYEQNGVVVFEIEKNGESYIVAQVGYDTFGGRTGSTQAFVKKQDNLPSNINDILIEKAAQEWLSNDSFLVDNDQTQSNEVMGKEAKKQIEKALADIQERKQIKPVTDEKAEQAVQEPLLEGLRDGGAKAEAGQESPELRAEKEVVAEERFTVNKTEYIKRGDEYFSKPSKGKEKPITQKVFENAKAKVKQADERTTPAPTVSEPVSKAATEAQPQAEKGVGETVQQGAAATRQPATEASATDVATIFESVAQAYVDMKNMKPKDARAKKAEIKETLKANPKADFIFTNWNKLKKQLKFTTKGDCP